MKVLFKYRDESPFLMPGYSRYNEVIGMSGEKHVGMIHLAHKDWRVADGTMPPYVEMTITPKLKQEIEKNVEEPGKSDVSRSKGVAKRSEAKPEASQSTSRSRGAVDEPAERRSDRRSGRAGTPSKSKGLSRSSKKGR